MSRKKYQGKFNDKERSKKKLVNAVGKVLQSKGYTGLTATNIAKAAGLSRRLITIYFDSVEDLIETYVRNKDYWIEASGNIEEKISDKRGGNTKEIIENLLQNQLKNFYDNPEMQKLILWEISENSIIMDQVSQERENMGAKILSLADKDFQDKDIDIRAVSALLVAGILHGIARQINRYTLL